ncbi:hypothetical protein EPA93_25195 [Ktedonosporobacter rubrisoli]|uniref:Uncharacterized protein n=1 Tax=Ktedonosporobacter rubrisoli TaxID=2509675 RepID=A0A4V0YZB1_KTERU|nr:hypothetical protein [Ktedonosporobacter rubrisoli]QBD79101.1 hypothetical protein EPA93_25195 [Ktedonosporobacter rubrisoli]
MQQQQQADYDLLAVFPDEAKAEKATQSLHKAGFSEGEVYQLEQGMIGSGVFREHGPNASRSEFFLQTRRSGPNPLLVVLLAIIFGVVLGALGFGASFAVPGLPEPTTLIAGVVLGLIIGAIIGLLRRGRVRGDIGQAQRSNSQPPGKADLGARTVVALRFPDTEDLPRKSRARAILLNSGGKIDRSVKRLTQ